MKFSVSMSGGAQMGILWTGIEKVVVYGINFVQGVILARLLCPEDFGLTAMLGIFLGLGGTLAESGLGTALVIGVKGRGDGVRRLERQVLGWNVGTAVCICAVLALAAPQCAAWYGKPMLTPILRAMAAGLVINACSVVATARLTREGRFGRLAGVNGLSTILGASVAIALAWAGCGVWSIVGLGLVSAVFRTGFAWLAARGGGDEAEAASAADGMDFRAALKYGWKLMLSGLIHVFYMESYNMVIGKMWSPAAVGLFSRGQRWARLPGEVVNDAVGRVALPALSRPNGDGALRFTLVNAALLWPGLVVLWAWAPQIVGLVLGEQWLDCVPYLRILIVGQFFTAGGNIALQQLRASGRSELVLKTDMWKKPIGFAALACGIPFGVAGLCWAKVVSDVAECVADVAYALKCRAAGDPPVDLVYCWYSGKIPDGMDACRMQDNGELFYSIKSVDRFAPWFRCIHVLVNDDTVVPEWLARHAKTRIIRHSECIPREVLPLYNAVSIEMWLHRIPDLSERFVYSNDDMFLGRPVSPCDFFDARGRMICRYCGYGDVRDAPGNPYESMIQYSRRFLGDAWRRYPHHNMDGYLKSVIEDFWKAYPDEALRSGSFRNRVPNQQQRDVFSCFAVKTGRGVRRIADRWVRLRRLLGLMPYTSLCFSLADDNIVDWIRRDRPKFFCLNDTEACTDADRAKVRTLLEEVYAS